MTQRVKNTIAIVLGAAMLSSLLFFTSPIHTTTKTSKTLSDKELLIITKSQYPLTSTYIFDSKYKTPIIEWLKSTYYKEFRKELARHGIIKWKESFDCDHFARYYTAYLETKYLSETFMNKSGPQSVAVGTLFYLVGGRKDKGHAINCAISDDGKIVLIEPQNGNIVTLTGDETTSVFLILW